MIKQNGYLQNLLVFQNSLSPYYCLFKYMDRVNWTEWVFEKKKKKKPCFQGSHFVSVGEHRVVLVMMVCVGGGVNEVYMELYGCHWVWGWVCKLGWVCVWGCGWVGEWVFDSGIVYMLILAISMSTVFWKWYFPIAFSSLGLNWK